MNALTGSKVINAARVMGLKNKIVFYGQIGNDLEGKKAIKDLKNFGFDISCIKISKNESTGRVVVATNKTGAYSVYIYFGANKGLNTKYLTNSLLQKVDAIYTDTGNDLAFDYDLIKKANLNNIPIFFDVPNKQNEFDKSRKHKIDFFMPNRFEAEALTNIKIKTIKDAEIACLEIRKFIDGNILITLDADGVVLLHRDKNEVLHYITDKLSAVDSTGAGDIFRGIFTSEIINGRDITSAIAKANKIAGSSVLYKGLNEKLKVVGRLVKFPLLAGGD